ncbi:hypothetical protein [Pseudogracilibacillus sp. SO30301A]|uniref:hypothetical protein n=1 Tax=Pseudogracilibacillus sp. SO30301A TaxID=3098291 RepID=UPI00300E4075
MFGLHENNSEVIQNKVIRELKEYFDDKITSGFTVLERTDTPYTMFSLSFIAYDYFNVTFNYDRGRFGCYTIVGDKKIPLRNSQQWYDKADMDVFLQELEQQIELRIPDKFLEFHGWK